MSENINHPAHYTSHPSGVECVDIAEHLSFNLGNALKYLWRAGQKGGPEKEREDRKKALWYLRREWSLSMLDPHDGPHGHRNVCSPVIAALFAAKTLGAASRNTSGNVNGEQRKDTALVGLLSKLTSTETVFSPADFQRLIDLVTEDLR